MIRSLQARATSFTVWLRRIEHRMIFLWRLSAQIKTVGKMFIVSALVMLILGFTLVSFMAQRILDAKVEVANSSIDRARRTVEQQVDSWDTSNSVKVRINAARSSLSDRVGGAGTGTDTTSSLSTVFEPVLIAPDENGQEITSPSDAHIPSSLRKFVSQNQVAYQYQTLTRANGTSYKALIIGTPVTSEIQDLQLYLVMPLDNEESTLALMRGLISTTGVVLLVSLVGIAWTFSQQVTAPVRSASRIAERFAAGHLRERMIVDGQDEMARLAISFNSMASSLSNQINQLEEYGNLQKQFTSDVSHELRTPLTTVRMAADVIHSSADELDPASRRATELMIAELDRFELLLNDLLEISRHDAGVADLSPDNVDIRGCVRAAWKHVRAVAEEINVPVFLHMPDHPIYMDVDTRRVERILRNLIANAVDHSEGKPVDIALRANNYAVSIAVVDHGVGLKPGQSDLVFNRFWRADPSRVRHTGGTGLGLAIAREDAVLHGGLLEATGEPGVGSCFRLTLPTDSSTTVDPNHTPLPLSVGEEMDQAIAECDPLPSELTKRSQESDFDSANKLSGVSEPLTQAAVALQQRGSDSATEGAHNVAANLEGAEDSESDGSSQAEETAASHIDGVSETSGSSLDAEESARGESSVNSEAHETEPEVVAQDQSLPTYLSDAELGLYELVSEEELRAAAEMDDFEPLAQPILHVDPEFTDFSESSEDESHHGDSNDSHSGESSAASTEKSQGSASPEEPAENFSGKHSKENPELTNQRDLQQLKETPNED